MDAPDPPAWFVGDLGDAWVAAIAAALPPGTRRIDRPGPLPESWPDRLARGGTVVLHRPHLSDGDLETVTRLKVRSGVALRVVVCVGPQARYRDVERWAAAVDVVLPEATARETIGRHVLGAVPRMPATRPRVAVVSALYELRMTLADACRAAGYPAEPAADWSGTAARWAVWDVPVLDHRWPRRLAREARSRVVLALMGFADRRTVALARRCGASACLDLPCDPADLGFVLDRLVAAEGTPDAPHAVPPAPAGRRRVSSRTGLECVE